MNTVEFTITQVWDLPSREPLLVTGTLASGEIHTGAVLHNLATDVDITIQGLDLHAHRGNEFTLLIDRSDAPNAQIGHRLVSPTASHTSNR